MSKAEYTVLVPLAADLAPARELLEIAAALVPVRHGESRGRVVALGIVEIPDELAFGGGALAVRQERQRCGRGVWLKKAPAIEFRRIVGVSTRVWEGVREAAREEQGDLIVVGGKAGTS